MCFEMSQIRRMHSLVLNVELLWTLSVGCRYTYMYRQLSTGMEAKELMKLQTLTHDVAYSSRRHHCIALLLKLLIFKWFATWVKQHSSLVLLYLLSHEYDDSGDITHPFSSKYMWTEFEGYGYQGHFPWEWNVWRMKLTTHLYRIANIRLLGAVVSLFNTSSWCGACLSTGQLFCHYRSHKSYEKIMYFCKLNITVENVVMFEVKP